MRGVLIFLAFFVAAPSLFAPPRALAASVTFQNVDGAIQRVVSIRAVGEDDRVSDNLSLSGNMLDEYSSITHRGVTAVSHNLAALTVAPDSATMSGSVDAFIFGEPVFRTDIAHRLQSVGTIEFVVGPGGTELVVSASGERGGFGSAAGEASVAWILDGDIIDSIGSGNSNPGEVQPYQFNATRAFARGTHKLQFALKAEIISTAESSESFVLFDLAADFSTPAVPPSRHE